MRKNGGKLVIVNLQKTPLDNIANLIIHARIQTVMKMLMEKLEVPIPEFVVERGINVWMENSGQIKAQGTTMCATNFENFKTFNATYNKDAKDQVLKFSFFNHYRENTISVNIPTEFLMN